MGRPFVSKNNKLDNYVTVSFSLSEFNKIEAIAFQHKKHKGALLGIVLREWLESPHIMDMYTQTIKQNSSNISD